MIVAAVIGALLLWTFVFYPLISRLLAARKPSQSHPAPTSDESWPHVLMLIAARDEAPHIAARVRNALALDYPGSLEVVVVSDGSTDATAAEARAAGATVVELPHVGKTAALETALRNASAAPDVVAFSDATAVWPSDALRVLLAPLRRPDVGAVSGLVRYDYASSGLAAGFASYQRLIVAHRGHDGTWGSLTSVSGSISATRWTVLAQPAGGTLPPALSTDLLIPFEAARRGLRTVFAPGAVSHERARASAARELQSRVRLALSAYAFMAHAARHWASLPATYRWQLVSHKVLRWLSPSLIVVAALALVLDTPEARVPVLLALGSLAVVCALAYVRALNRVLGPVLFAATVALGYLIGLWRFARGQRPAGWDPAEQR